jgi:hypothetical protein
MERLEGSLVIKEFIIAIVWHRALGQVRVQDKEELEPTLARLEYLFVGAIQRLCGIISIVV